MCANFQIKNLIRDSAKYIRYGNNNGFFAPCVATRKADLHPFYHLNLKVETAIRQFGLRGKLGRRQDRSFVFP